MEEQLKQLIEQAKATNNTVLVEQLNQALNTFLAQQKQQENEKLKAQENINQEENTIQEAKKEEVVQESKVEKEEKQSKIKEEDIKKVANGEVSRLITMKNDKIILESAYMQIHSSAKNSTLRTHLNSILITLALDDVTKEKKATAKLYKLLETYENPEDIQDIQTFLNDISKIGRVGLEAKESIINGYDNNQRKEVFNKYFDDEYEKRKKNADLLDMEYDELIAKPLKNPDDFEEMIDRYLALIQKLEKLYDETANKIDIEKTQKIEETILYLKSKITTIKKYHAAIKDAAQFADRSFNF